MHVLDASRVVGVLNSLLDPDGRMALDVDNRADQQRLPHPARGQTAETASAARGCARQPDADQLAGGRPLRRHRSSAVARSHPRSPSCAGAIDWTFFFHAWELKGRFPPSSTIPARARPHATSTRPPRRYSTGIESDATLQARGVYGFWPALAEEDDIVLADGSRFPDAAPADRLRRLAPQSLACRLHSPGGQRPRPPEL